MCSIDIKRISKRERNRVVESRVRRRVVVLDRRLGKTRDQLLDPTNALDFADWGTISGSIPEADIKTEENKLTSNPRSRSGTENSPVVEAFPFFLGKQLAELGVPERNGLHAGLVSSLPKQY